MKQLMPTVIAVCCREWVCAANGTRWGRCGLCGERPVSTGRSGPDVEVDA